ncbi:hypothetical protein EV363DRAFT_1418729 [Boletus edulis]|nr:hypothetical protein EV363DRAFT_1418729 [Boletus edulis]
MGVLLGELPSLCDHGSGGYLVSVGIMCSAGYLVRARRTILVRVGSGSCTCLRALSGRAGEKDATSSCRQAPQLAGGPRRSNHCRDRLREVNRRRRHMADAMAEAAVRKQSEIAVGKRARRWREKEEEELKGLEFGLADTDVTVLNQQGEHVTVLSAPPDLRLRTLCTRQATNKGG